MTLFKQSKQSASPTVDDYYDEIVLGMKDTHGNKARQTEVLKTPVLKPKYKPDESPLILAMVGEKAKAIRITKVPKTLVKKALTTPAEVHKTPAKQAPATKASQSPNKVPKTPVKATSPASQAPSTPKSQGARTVPQSPHGPGGVTVIVETRPAPSGPRYIHKNPAYLVPSYQRRKTPMDPESAPRFGVPSHQAETHQEGSKPHYHGHASRISTSALAGVI